MAIAKRIFFFVLVNILVMVSVSIVTSAVCMYLYGTPYPPSGSLIPYAIWAGIWGMGGAFISLLLSKTMAKHMMGVKIIDPQTRGPEKNLWSWFMALQEKLVLEKMPEVGIYQSPEMNAFATGPSKSNSLVAVSSGLLNQMNRSQLEGVLGHEVAHIANGDMVTLTLIQGVINAFVLFFSRIIASVIASQFERNRWMIEFALYIVLQIAFSLMGSIVVAYFSRIREYRADKGGARYSSRENMISALQALANGPQFEPQKEDNFAAFKISSGAKVMALFRTHPPLQDRIARLQKGY